MTLHVVDRNERVGVFFGKVLSEGDAGFKGGSKAWAMGNCEKINVF